MFDAASTQQLEQAVLDLRNHIPGDSTFLATVGHILTLAITSELQARRIAPPPPNPVIEAVGADAP